MTLADWLHRPPPNELVTEKVDLFHQAGTKKMIGDKSVNGNCLVGSRINTMSGLAKTGKRYK
jgi:hypothetical protein